MGRELELKYQCNAEVFSKIREKYNYFTSITMETTYYDTPGRSLSQKRWMLRRRKENGRSVCTLKTPLPDGSRGEWETECEGLEAAIPQLLDQGASAELRELTAPGLRETCSARFLRLAATLTLPDCTVELALDQGAFYGGGKEQPFRELEVEYKSGSEEAALRFAQSLAEEYGLLPEPKSKLQRALALLP